MKREEIENILDIVNSLTQFFIYDLLLYFQSKGFDVKISRAAYKEYLGSRVKFSLYESVLDPNTSVILDLFLTSPDRRETRVLKLVRNNKKDIFFVPSINFSVFGNEIKPKDKTEEVIYEEFKEIAKELNERL